MLATNESVISRTMVSIEWIHPLIIALTDRQKRGHNKIKANYHYCRLFVITYTGWGSAAAESVAESRTRRPGEGRRGPTPAERARRLNERIAETLKEVLLFITSEYIFV